MITTSEAYVSIGRLADKYDCRKQDVEAAATEAGVTAKSWDGVVYFAAADDPRIALYLDSKGAK